MKEWHALDMGILRHSLRLDNTLWINLHKITVYSDSHFAENRKL